ncbi:MAG: Panacea domain-containing protein [Candidatus Phytoplasma pyri]
MQNKDQINIFDVANYIIANKKIPDLTNLKLQKLIFYIYAVYLVKTNQKTKMFHSNIEAWPYGPVFPELYFVLSKFHNVIIDKTLDIDFPKVINNLPKSCIEYILQKYGNLKAWQLASQIYDADFWSDVYVDNIAFVDNKITDNVIFEYYYDEFNDFKIYQD